MMFVPPPPQDPAPDTSADKAGAHSIHVRVLGRVIHANVHKLEVEVLVHRMQCAADPVSRFVRGDWQAQNRKHRSPSLSPHSRQVILQLDSDLLPHECLEDGLEELRVQCSVV